MPRSQPRTHTKAAPLDLSRSEQSRRRLLEAGTRLFSAYGFRRTSMEAIASEAGVAKATAYAHFANKDAVFAAVITYAADQMIARAEIAASRASMPVDAVLASLTSKQTEFYRLVHATPHARELVAAFESAGAAETESAHARYAASLQRLLVACPGIGTKLAPSLATLLDHAAQGIAERARDEHDLAGRLALLVKRVVG